MAGRPLSYTEEQAREAIATSYSWAESLRKLELCSTGGAWRVLKKYADLWNIPTDHFDPATCIEGNLRLPARPLDQVLVEHSTYSRQHVKRRLFQKGLKEPICEMCGQGEMWHGRPMGMILDQRYCSRACGTRWDRSRLRGKPKPGIRRTKRPPYEQLLAEIEAQGYCAIGRKYGVSDNAARKWVKFYERERQAQESSA